MAATELPLDMDQMHGMFNDFIHEVQEDFQSPGISHFQKLIPSVKKNVLSLEQSLHSDKKSVSSMRDALKELATTGDDYHVSLANFAEELKKFGQRVSCSEAKIGNLFITYGLIIQQVSALNGDLVNSMKNVLLASLNLVIDIDLQGSKYKSHIDKDIASYESAKHRVERDERAQLRTAGLSWRDKSFQPEELAGRLEDNRRRFQLQVVDYMVKVIDVKTKRGVDYAEHLQGYSKSVKKFFDEGSELMNMFKSWNEKKEAAVHQHREDLDACKKKLKESQEKLKNYFKVEDVATRYRSHTTVFSDITDKSGYLLKKPDLKLNLRFARRNWPKKYCSTNMMGFTMANSHTHPPSLAVPPLSFKCNEVGEQDGHKFCFELFTPQRTYVFAAETEKDLREWKATMDNCMAKFISGGGTRGNSTRVSRRASSSLATNIKQRKQLVKSIAEKIKQYPGNQLCCDCNSRDPVWLSVNLGVLVCLQCSGIHRNLSVQVSRIRSLDLDDLQTFELLIAFSMGNQLFNEVMEATLSDPKPSQDTNPEQRAQFIRNKYVQRKYIERSDTEDSLDLLYEAIDVRDFRALLQSFAEGVAMSQPLPNREDKYTALHLAVEQEDLTSLHIVEFMTANSRTVDVMDSLGNTPLHIAAQQGMLECLKILLRNGARWDAENGSQQTALMVVEELEDEQLSDCVDLLRDAQRKKLQVCDTVSIDWGVDEDDDIYQVPTTDSTSLPRRVHEMKHPRPLSTVQTGSSSSNKIINSLKRTKSVSPERVMDATDNGVIQRLPPEVFIPPPPLPERTDSQSAVPLGRGSGPMRPKRRQKSSDTTVADSCQDSPDGPAVPPSLPPKPPPAVQVLFIAEAQYDCVPDKTDELSFHEGDKLVITKELNQDWLRGYILGNPDHKGIIPSNYVQKVSDSDST